MKRKRFHPVAVAWRVAAGVVWMLCAAWCFAAGYVVGWLFLALLRLMGAM